MAPPASRGGPPPSEAVLPSLGTPAPLSESLPPSLGMPASHLPQSRGHEVQVSLASHLPFPQRLRNSASLESALSLESVPEQAATTKSAPRTKTGKFLQ